MTEISSLADFLFADGTCNGNITEAESRVDLSSSSHYRLGFDIGGTFTDLVAIDEQTGELTVVKCPTTPSDPSEGVMNGLKTLFDRLQITGSNLAISVHSTTLVTNTVIERKGAKTALLTTKGFRDVLEIGREKRITVYDIFEEKLRPLVPRRMRMEVDERTFHDGTSEKKLDRAQVTKIANQLRKESFQSLAISFLHSYANPSHEKEARRIVSKVAPNIMISVSSDILPEWREYERTSTTVINAYSQPRTANYMHIIESALRKHGFEGRLFIMQSSGGLCTVATASKFPVRIIESGPAAGALAATYLGALGETKNMISFDMGGTTAKCCLIIGGEPRVTSDFEVAGYMYLKGSGYPVRIPTIDLLEIGAGGGSIAHLEYGLLKVGPQSAGADPGPACYPWLPQPRLLPWRRDQTRQAKIRENNRGETRIKVRHGRGQGRRWSVRHCEHKHVKGDAHNLRGEGTGSYFVVTCRIWRSGTGARNAACASPEDTQDNSASCGRCHVSTRTSGRGHEV